VATLMRLDEPTMVDRDAAELRATLNTIAGASFSWCTLSAESLVVVVSGSAIAVVRGPHGEESVVRACGDEQQIVSFDRKTTSEVSLCRDGVTEHLDDVCSFWLVEGMVPARAMTVVLVESKEAGRSASGWSSVEATIPPQVLDILEGDPHGDEPIPPAGEAAQSVEPAAVVGSLLLDDGRRVRLDGDLIIGRGINTHDSSPWERGTRRLSLDDPSQSIGRSHARIHATGTDLFVEDLDTVNGTELIGPDGRRRSLRAGQRMQLWPGWQLVLGRRITISIGAPE